MADIRTLAVLLLVSDIKGYSRFAQKLAPDALAQMIGSWYREYDQILHFYGATVDKFIGDAVLAYWLDVAPAARLQAVRAAHALQAACDRISAENHEVFGRLGLRLESGVGLHLGTVAHGQIEKGTFTLLGEAVNEAFQIEALTRRVGRDILLSEEFLEGWDAGRAYCADEGTQEIPGHEKGLRVFSLTLTPTR
jgi:adenylate cyclase